MKKRSWFFILIKYRRKLEKLLENLENVADWDGEVLQTTLSATSKELQIQQSLTFKAVYLSFLGKERGPKAGALLSYLDRALVVDRLRDVIEANLSNLSTSLS